MMGEVKFSIRVYGVLAGLGVCYLLVGGWRWYGAKSFIEPAEVRTNVFGGCNNSL